MNLKEKLDLLWKYLLLALLISVVIMIVTRRDACWITESHGFYGKPHSMDVRVEKKVVNGDTTTVIWVGGEKIEDVDEFLKSDMHIFKSKDGKVLKMKLDHSKELKKIHIETMKEDD